MGITAFLLAICFSLCILHSQIAIEKPPSPFTCSIRAWFSSCSMKHPCLFATEIWLISWGVSCILVPFFIGTNTLLLFSHLQYIYLTIGLHYFIAGTCVFIFRRCYEPHKLRNLLRFFAFSSSFLGFGTILALLIVSTDETFSFFPRDGILFIFAAITCFIHSALCYVVRIYVPEFHQLDGPDGFVKKRIEAVELVGQNEKRTVRMKNPRWMSRTNLRGKKVRHTRLEEELPSESDSDSAELKRERKEWTMRRVEAMVQRHRRKKEARSQSERTDIVMGEPVQEGPDEENMV